MTVRAMVAQWNSGLGNHGEHDIFVVRFAAPGGVTVGWGIECATCDEVIYEEPCEP
jgi:hypothetical protein